MLIVDVGPRDGLQNEPDVLAPEIRAQLVGKLVGSGIRAVEVASFVDPRRVPQMAGAEEVVATLDRVDEVVYAGLALNERGYDRLLACGLAEVRFAFGATESFNRRNQNASVRESLEAALRIVERARADGIRSAVTVSVAFGCPFEGTVDEGRVLELASEIATARPDTLLLADTIGVAVPGQVRRLVSRAGGARRSGRRALPQHAQHGLRKRARRARGRRDRARCLGGRPRRLPVRAPRDREHRDRRSRLPARTARASRPGSTSTRSSGSPRGWKSVLGRQLEGQVYRAGGFPSA